MILYLLFIFYLYKNVGLHIRKEKKSRKGRHGTGCHNPRRGSTFFYEDRRVCIAPLGAALPLRRDVWTTGHLRMRDKNGRRKEHGQNTVNGVNIYLLEKIKRLKNP